MRIALAAQAPFHLEATVRVLQRRPVNRVDVWERNSYVRVLDVAGEPVLARIRNHGTVDDPDVRCVTRGGPAGSAARSMLRQTVRRMLGLDVDPAALERTLAAHRTLHAATRPLRGMRPPQFPALFEAFANVVPFQQVSIDAGVAVTGRLVERFGARVDADRRERAAFPTAARIADASVAQLRDCGLSARKAETLKRLAQTVATGVVSTQALDRMPTPEALQVLTALPGIGPWSAALVLLRGLGRLDVFPPGDVGARRSVGALMRLGADDGIEAAVARFGAHRGYVYFCGLGSNLVARGLIHPPETSPT